VISTEIAPELLTEDQEVICELITAAINDASRKVNELTKEMMSRFTGLLGGMAGE